MKHKNTYYLIAILAFFVIPSGLLYLAVHKEISIVPLLILGGIFSAIGVFIDNWATKHGWRDHFWLWSFNDRLMLGPKFFDIPLEKYLFFFIVPIFIVTLWEFLNMILVHPSVNSIGFLFTILIWAAVITLLPTLRKPN